MPTDEQPTTAHTAELHRLIADVLELPVAEITAESRFVDDLEVDSLASLQIAVQVEKRFGVSIGETHLASLASVGEMTELVESRMAGKSGG